MRPPALSPSPPPKVDKTTGLTELSMEYHTITKLLYLEPVYVTSAVWAIILPSILQGLPYMRIRTKDQQWEWQGVIFNLLLASQLQKRILGGSPDGGTIFFRTIIKDVASRDIYYLHVFRLDHRLLCPAPTSIIISLADHYQ